MGNIRASSRMQSQLQEYIHFQKSVASGLPRLTGMALIGERMTRQEKTDASCFLPHQEQPSFANLVQPPCSSMIVLTLRKRSSGSKPLLLEQWGVEAPEDTWCRGMICHNAYTLSCLALPALRPPALPVPPQAEAKLPPVATKWLVLDVCCPCRRCCSSLGCLYIDSGATIINQPLEDMQSILGFCSNW